MPYIAYEKSEPSSGIMQTASIYDIYSLSDLLYSDGHVVKGIVHTLLHVFIILLWNTMDSGC